MTSIDSHERPERQQNGHHVASSSVSFLPEIPATDVGLSLEFEMSLDPSWRPDDPEVHKVHKRASNVMKLAQENDKLRAELRGMSERLEAAERKRLEIARQQELRDQKMREVQAAMEAQQALEEAEEEEYEEEDEVEEHEEIEDDLPGPDDSHAM